MRDGEGQGEQGGITFIGGSDTGWEPTDLLLACDFTLAAPLIVEKTIPIPAGRTFRLALSKETYDETHLPTLSFADATSRLELASNAIGTDGKPLGIPAKYQTMLCTQSGTLVLDRNVSADGFTISDWRAYYDGLSVNRPLETHLILRAGHTYTFNGMFGFADLGTKIGTATLTIEGGTVTTNSLNLTATNTTLDIQGGIVTADGLTGFDAGAHTDVTIAQGATLSLKGALAAGEADAAGTLDLTVRGTLNLTGDVYMTPALRRTLRVEGGTINATSKADITCTDGDTPTAEDYLVVSDGGTFSGPLTVDSVTGNGTLKIGEGAKVSTLYAYNGTIEGTVEGTGMIGTFTGDLGDVTLGGDWLTGEGKSLTDVVDKAQNYHGTLGFTAGTAETHKTIDFAAVAKLTELPGAFRVAEYQDVTMRLDQYIDATVRWPSPATGVTLTLIESGAYGGEAEIPVVPAGVNFAFQYYNDKGALVDRLATDYQRVPSEDGVSDELTWENAVFTGQGAWIDIEFNGDTRNTGWFTLGDYNGNPAVTEDQRDRYNGLLGGDNIPSEGDEDIYEVLTQGKEVANWGNGYTVDFTDSKHPEQADGSLPLWYRPFVALGSLEYPEAWTVSLRLSAPNAAHACILALGHNYTDTTAGTPKYEGDVYSLIFATGATPNEICLWVVPGLEGEGVSGTVARPEAPAFTVTLADATTAQHTFSVICDGTTLNLYVDGAWLGEHALPGEGARLTNGLQVGVQLGASAVPPAIKDGFADKVKKADGGSIDFLRFYKGAMPASAMVEIADRTPYVRENLRYVRYVPIDTAPDGFTKTVPKGGETWIQPGAWLAETWNGSAWVAGAYADQPAEGAECRILVAAGEHALQVNVERQVEAKAADGTVTNEGRYFYSPNRTYASLVVRAQDEADRAATLRLVPLGVTEKETADTETAMTRPWESQLTGSAWFTTPEESSPGNRTGFRYGTLRFTGGAEDPITSDTAIKNFHGAGYLLDAASVGVDGIYDAGVCYLSKYGNVELLPNGESPLLSRLTMVAGMSLTRGMVDEVARWQLTGPVVLPDEATSADHVLGHPELKTQDPNNDQDSEDVWVPFFGAGSTWKFYDDTRRVEGGTDNANGALTGLFARGVQTPGRLYLDFTVGDKLAEGNFSEQAWYRYGYEANQTTSTLSGMKPERAKEGDFAQAVAFQIRLSEKTGDVTLTLDNVPKARVQTFYVEESARTTGDPLTLVLKTVDRVGALTVWQRVIAAARLDVSNDRKGNALNLRPEEAGRHTPVHRGNSKRGAYVVGPMTVDWNFGAESSVPRLEVATGCELTFTVGQDFRRYDTTVTAQEGAWIHHVSDAPFLGQDVELGAGSTLGFHATAAADTAREEGVVLAGRLVLHGSATLRAEGGSGNRLPRFFAAGGIVAEPLEAAGEAGQTGAELTVHAEEGANWRSRTAALTGEHFGLRKTGPGTVTFDTDVPPSVSGLVSVDAGTLNVTAAADTPVGKQGLHVAKDATLGDSGRMVGEGRLLAAIPAGQELSGGGKVDGVLRLESGATYLAKQGEALTVEGGLDVGDGGSADVNVILPADYVGDTHYLVSGVEERTIRRRFKPTLGDARWDAIAWLQVQGGKTYTYYAARKPAMPVPAAGDLEGNETENAWHDGFEKIMVNQYQSLGHAYVGATQGRTRAGTRPLSASEINEALYAFSGISAFAPSGGAATGGRTYIDAHDFFVAYEFGVSGMTFTQDGKRVVVEVTVRNALAESFGEAVAAAAAEGAAAFRTKTTITFQAVKDGKAEPLTVSVEEVANLDGEAGVSDSADKRYFALPYDALKDLFGDAPILLRPSASKEVDLPGSSEAL